MLADYVTRGVTAGLVAGLVFGIFVAAVANPLVGYAGAVNGGDPAGHDHAHAGHTHGGAVSTGVTKAVSVVAGVLWGVLLGGVVFGVAFYLLEPAIPGTGATKSYVLAGAGFLTVSGAPWLALPPVAPGTEQSLPVSTRLLVYGGMMVAGALASLSAGYAYRRLAASRGRFPAVVGAALSLCLLAVPATLAPSNAVRGSLSPDLRAGLTGLFVFGQLLVWLSLAAAHAHLRGADRASVPTEGPVAAD